MKTNLLSFQERSGEVSSERRTLDNRHRTLDKRRTVDTGQRTKGGFGTLDIKHRPLKEEVFFFVKRLYFHHNFILKQTTSATQEKNATKQGLKFTLLTLAQNYRYDFFLLDIQKLISEPQFSIGFI